MNDLVRGANAPLAVHRLVATASCAVPVDVSALLVAADMRVRSDADLVFFNAPEGPGARWSDPAGGQRIDIDLTQVPADVQAVLIVVSLVGRMSFGAVPPPRLLLTGADGAPLVTFTVDELGPEKALLGLELYRRAGAWKVRALGQGYAGGLAELVVAHGVEVDDPGDAETAAPPPPPVGATGPIPGQPTEPHPSGPGGREVGFLERAWLIWEDASRSLAAFRSSTEHALNIRNDEVAGRVPRGRYQELMDAATSRLSGDAAQLRDELTRQEPRLTPEVAPFTEASWLTWQPRTDLADGVLLGRLTTPEMPELHVPLVLRVPWRRGVWISQGPLPGDAAAYAWSLVTRFLAAVPPGLVGLEVIDAAGLSGAGWVNGFDQATTQALLGGGLAIGPAAEQRVRGLLDLVDLRRIGGSEDELPATLAGGPPVRLVVILDAGAALDGEESHQLLRLVEDGPTVGVPVMLVETDSRATESVRSMRLRQMCNTLPAGEGPIVDNWVGTEWTLTPDLLPDAGAGTRAPALLAHVLAAHVRAIASHG
ncbi:stress protein [Actinomadura craniellae]|uniref:Stress protein n=1 Tax=Actinomadura craniellae TaxID=2231787 RepID=A0A365H8S4_9ACTN|nr:TerD family protein [Actinomadura craniellae]RAY15505.1 stress protein [Actinomadura craniellae]